MEIKTMVPSSGAGEANVGLDKKVTIWDPLRVMIMDVAGYKENRSKMLDLLSNNPNTVSMVILFNTGLDVKTSLRRDTMWPDYRQIRADQRGGGMMAQFHYSLEIEELTGLPSEIAGLWMVVRGGMVEGKEKISVVGVVVDMKKNTEEVIMLYLSKCLLLVEDRFGTEVELVVYISKDLNEAYNLAPIPAITFTRPAPGASLLSSSPSLQSRPLCQGGTLITTRPTGCSLCSAQFKDVAQLSSHRETAGHRRNFLYRYYQMHKKDLLTSPHVLGLELTLVQADNGVEMSVEQGLVEVVCRPGEVKQFKIQFKNVNTVDEHGSGEDLSGIVVETVGVPREEGVIKLSDEHNLTGEEDTKIRIKPGKRYRVAVTCTSPMVGQYKVPVVVAFYHEQRSDRVGDGYRLSHMALELWMKVQTEEIIALLPTNPFCPPKKFTPWHTFETVRGKSPAMLEMEDSLVVKMPVGKFPLSEARRKVIGSRMQGEGDTTEEMMELIKCRNLLEGKLTEENYTERWELLLHFEQWQEERDIRYFDMVGVTMKMERNSGLLVLEVPGLQENRPSVLKGDKLYVRETERGLMEYEGVVHVVGDKQVWLGFSDKLVAKLKRGMVWDVRFSVSTFPVTNMHRAVKLAKSLSLTSSLFPSSLGFLPPRTQLPQLHCFDTNVESNPEQLAAVMSILTGESGKAPYLVFGPPGTGKTVTLVEAIKQVWKLHSNSHILATAPSNTAADLLAVRLAKDIPAMEMMRLNAVSRSMETFPDSLRPISNLTDAGYNFPPMSQLCKYRVLVTTLVTAGKLVSAMFPPNHFQHVFIDEAGQATEPEACIALAGLVTSTSQSPVGQIVMAGDPRQLGPVVRSPLGEKHGLSVSLLERLMKSPPYSSTTTGYDVRCITKLIRNFRSHSALLSLPAKMYYSSKLVPCADRVLVESCINFPGLTDSARGKTPLLVHGVIGQDLREETSPSFFNPEEVVLVLGFIDQLLAMSEHKVEQEDIGVITPYRRQVQKIRRRLEQRGLQGVTVGTTEEFQGQERRIIILSTVRSSPEYVNIDSQYRLGFLADPKRFCVAITRAQALLIVVGNPHILYQDKEWRQLLEYARTLHCYTGCAFPDQTEEEVGRLENRFSKLIMDRMDRERVEEMGWSAYH